MVLLRVLVFKFIVSSYLFGQALVPEATEIYKEVEMVTPGEGNGAPSDAVILFDGTNLDAWESSNDGNIAPWKIGEWNYNGCARNWLYKN